MANPLRTFLSDLNAPIQRDPAAKGPLDVLLSYPGFHALTAHRFIHALHRMRIPFLPRYLSNLNRFVTGIEIHPAAKIAPGVFIDHGMGVVIGETAEVAEGCTIYQGVTLGGTSLSHCKRHPTIGANVVIGANAAVLGAITVGDNSRIGSNSVVVKDVPANSTVVGVPGRLVAQDGKPVRAVSDVPRVEMPDPNAQALASLSRRLSELEARLTDVEGVETQEEPWSWVI